MATQALWDSSVIVQEVPEGDRGRQSLVLQPDAVPVMNLSLDDLDEWRAKAMLLKELPLIYLATTASTFPDTPQGRIPPLYGSVLGSTTTKARDGLLGRKGA